MTGKNAALTTALALSLTLSGCLSSSENADTDSVSGDDVPVEQPPSEDDRPGGDGPTPQDYQVEVRRTSFGIPHIEADNFASMGYGYGYVQAEDNLCLLARDTLTIRGRRAEFLGGDGDYIIPSNGLVTDNVSADFFWRTVMSDETLEQLRDSSDPEVVAASRGYVDGFNRYLSELKGGQHPGRHDECADEPWLFELTEKDMYRRYFRLSVLASSSVFAEGIANAAPPPSEQLPTDELPIQPQEQAADIIDRLLDSDINQLPFPLGGDLPIGSNMYGFGPKATQSGQSMLFGNPHFPWQETERLYMARLSVGDETEIMGAALYGLPAVLIGFNEDFAWSHTVSTAFRFSLYELQLDPLDPTRYLYEGEYRDMSSEDITIRVKNDDGDVEEQTRTLYHSHYGPMLTFEVSDIPVLNWSPVLAYTIRDANAENDRMVNQFFRWNAADSLDEFIDIHEQVLGTPWVNTIATGPDEPAYYGDVTVVPHVTDTKKAQCTTALSPVFDLLQPGIALLDGSRERCEWGSDEDAPADGIFGPSNLPQLVRDDWVHNCNDSHWLTNPRQPLTGFDSIIGDEQSARSLRTRMCITNVTDRLDASDGVDDTPGFTMDNLQEIALDGEVKSQQLAREQVLEAYCNPVSELPSTLLGLLPGQENAHARACQALREWDGTYNLDATGAHIWAEFWRRLNPLPIDSPLLWARPFNDEDPVNTPNTLNVAEPTVIAAFAEAIQAVADSEVAFDDRLGDIQFSGIHADQQRIPIFGGDGGDGAFAIATSRPSKALTDEGYGIDYGNSYIQAVTWDDRGNPVAEGFVTYSQSTDPASPYYMDMTEAYSEKQWIKFPFTESEVIRDTEEHFFLEGEVPEG